MMMGIGAGWKEDEYTSYGWDYPSAQVRISQLDEAIQVVKAMWSQSPANFIGQHYSLKNAYCEPRPDPAPLFMIGGGGEKYALRVIAKHADWWNCPFTSVQKFDHKLHVLKNHCKEIGRDPSTIRKTYFGFLSISNDPSKLTRREGLHVIAGTPDDVSAEIQRFVDLGVDYFIFRFLDFPELDSADLFLKEVLPRFQ
jgi:alkanesulfonate monooxygenase SsuD/methylene tetrahydromethanopterin reductase-like flavin-dependent oxidoreductase (luciferase family)